MTDDRFGISTHLFHDRRLTRDDLAAIHAHGFTTVEVFATRSHVDYRDDTAVAQLAGWLAETGLALHSVHAPVCEAMRAGRWVGAYSNASSDEARRQAAVAEAEAALAIARHVPFRYLVVHLGVPAAEHVAPADNVASAARRSVEDLVIRAEKAGIRVALELIPNVLSTAPALCDLVEQLLEDLDVGVCLDYGHANLTGDIGDAIETLAGHIWTTHVHDNGGQQDDHLVPYSGAIDWDAAMMETQKVGYDGVLMLEVAGGRDPIDTLRRAAKARERIEKSLVIF